MKKLITIILLIFNITGVAQTTNYQLQKNVVLTLKKGTIKTDTATLNLYRIEIENHSDSAYYFWFSRSKKTNFTNQKLIRNHFYKARGDFNLFQLATEDFQDNTKLPTTSFSYLTKIINKNSNFRYQIITTQRNSKQTENTIHELIKNHVVLIPKTDLKEYFDTKTINRILYKKDSITVNWDVLYKDIREETTAANTSS